MGVYDRSDKRKGSTHRNSAAARANNQRDIEFVNRELTTEETEAFRGWRQAEEDVFTELTELVEGGYRVTVKYDDYSSSCAAFIFPGPESENSGLCLTGRGGNAYRALAEVVFKHVYVFKGAWSLSTPARPGRDDPDY